MECWVNETEEHNRLLVAHVDELREEAALRVTALNDTLEDGAPIAVATTEALQKVG